MRKDLFFLLFVLLFSTFTYAQFPQVHSYQPTFYNVDNSQILESQKRFLESESNRNKNDLDKLASVKNKVLNYLQGETDVIFFKELINALEDLGKFGTYLNSSDVDELQKINNSVDMSYANYLYRKKYPQAIDSSSSATESTHGISIYAQDLTSIGNSAPTSSELTSTKNAASLVAGETYKDKHYDLMYTYMLPGPSMKIRDAYIDIYDSGILTPDEIKKIQKIVEMCVNGKFPRSSSLAKELKKSKSIEEKKEIFMKY